MKQQLNEVKQLQKIAGIKEGIEEGDRVKVVYGNEFYGETGTVEEVRGGFVIVSVDGKGEYSMHKSDVEKIEDEEDDDDYGSDDPDDDHGPMEEDNDNDYWTNKIVKIIRGKLTGNQGEVIGGSDGELDVKITTMMTNPIKTISLKDENGLPNVKVIGSLDDEDEDDHSPVTDYGKRRQDDDAKYYGLGEDSVRMWKSDNPEGDKMVMNFLKMIAKEFKYPPAKGNPLAQAAEFVKGRLKKLGYINEN